MPSTLCVCTLITYTKERLAWYYFIVVIETRCIQRYSIVVLLRKSRRNFSWRQRVHQNRIMRHCTALQGAAIPLNAWKWTSTATVHSSGWHAVRYYIMAYL